MHWLYLRHFFLIYFGPGLYYFTFHVDPDQQIAMQSDFTHMLKEIQNRFQDPAGGISPQEAVQALEETLASLHQIKKSLEETKEYRAAEEAQKQSDKGNRVRHLTASLEKAEAAAEAMLGYSLTSAHYRSSGSLYHLLPEGYLNHQAYDYQVKQFQSQLAKQEAQLDRIRGELGTSELTPAPPFLRGDLKQALEAKQEQLRSATAQVRCARSQLLSYMATHKPMRDAHFSDKLAGHLDAMLDAYLELQKLEQSELKP
jgi:DNA repair exonuclease SbcCD ATPase subunit